MNAMRSLRVGALFVSGGSGNLRNSATSCARATPPSFRALATAAIPVSLDVRSIGSAWRRLNSSEISLQSRGAHTSLPFFSTSFRSGMVSMNAPFASQETPRPLPAGVSRNVRTIEISSLRRGRCGRDARACAFAKASAHKPAASFRCYALIFKREPVAVSCGQDARGPGGVIVSSRPARSRASRRRRRGRA